jgi:hypothetical protein
MIIMLHLIGGKGGLDPIIATNAQQEIAKTMACVVACYL